MGLLDSLVGAATNAAFGGQQNSPPAQGGPGGLDPQLLIGLIGVLMNQFVRMSIFSGFDRFAGPEGLRACCLMGT